MQPSTEPPAARQATDREAQAQASAEETAAAEPAQPEPSVADDVPPEPAAQPAAAAAPASPGRPANGSCSGPTTGLCGTAAARSSPAWPGAPSTSDGRRRSQAPRGRSRPRRWCRLSARCRTTPAPTTRQGASGRRHELTPTPAACYGPGGRPSPRCSRASPRWRPASAPPARRDERATQPVSNAAGHVTGAPAR